MALRVGFLVALGVLYAAGMKLAAMHAPGWIIAVLMGVVFRPNKLFTEPVVVPAEISMSVAGVPVLSEN